MLDSILGSDFIMSLLAFGIILIPAIIIHELGHFFAAKAVGISILEFGIGFPPRMKRLFRWGETEFTLNWLPIGGFVLPLGEDFVGPRADGKSKRDNPDEEEIEEHTHSQRDELRRRGVTRMQSVSETRPLPRILFMAGGALANFVSAFLVFIIIGLTGVPEIVGGRVQVMNVPNNSIWAEAGVQLGDAVELINGEYFTGYESFYNTILQTNEPIRLTMLNAETGENYDITLPVDTDETFGYVWIVGVAQDSPAMDAGIEPNDVIARINGESIQNARDPISVLQEITEETEGQVMNLTLIRDGQLIEVSLVPRVDPPEGVGRIGINILPQFSITDGVRFADAPPQQEFIPRPFGDSLQYGAERTAQTFAVIASIPGQLLDGGLNPEDARPISIIGISRIGGELMRDSVSMGHPYNILNFFSLISIFLGVSNLLPIPALDGGRIVFVLIEMVRGKPISPEKEAMIHQIGIIILLGLGVLVMLYDLLNPIRLLQ